MKETENNKKRNRRNDWKLNVLIKTLLKIRNLKRTSLFIISTAMTNTDDKNGSTGGLIALQILKLRGAWECEEAIRGGLTNGRRGLQLC